MTPYFQGHTGEDTIAQKEKPQPLDQRDSGSSRSLPPNGVELFEKIKGILTSASNVVYTLLSAKL